MKRELGYELPEVRLNHIEKRYRNGKRALKDINYEFSKGIYGLLGPNGAGKSTLMKIISGNMSQTTGEVTFCGTPIKKMGAVYRKMVGFMPQQQALLTNFSGRHFLWYMASLKGMEKKQAYSRINELLQNLNMEDKADIKIEKYSGGMKQRILLAQALLDDPPIIVLDEPTAGLDPKERIRIRNYISGIASDKIVIIATHVVSDIDCIANEIILMEDGTVIQTGTPEGMIHLVDGMVWEKEMSKEEMNLLTDMQISNVNLRTGGSFLVRAVSEKPMNGWTSVQPTLEDVYLYYFGTDNTDT